MVLRTREKEKDGYILKFKARAGRSRLPLRGTGIDYFTTFAPTIANRSSACAAA
jgi:hypothetical protein